MNKIFEIEVNIMGDVTPQLVQVLYSKKNEEYELGFVNENENPRVKFTDDGKIVQTAGIPLDSNTLHHVSEQLKKSII